MDTFFGTFGAAAGAFAGAAEAMIKGECVLCKCNNTCTGETLWNKYFGLHAGGKLDPLLVVSFQTVSVVERVMAVFFKKCSRAIYLAIEILLALEMN